MDYFRLTCNLSTPLVTAGNLRPYIFVDSYVLPTVIESYLHYNKLLVSDKTISTFFFFQSYMTTDRHTTIYFPFIVRVYGVWANQKRARAHSTILMYNVLKFPEFFIQEKFESSKIFYWENLFHGRDALYMIYIMYEMIQNITYESRLFNRLHCITYQCTLVIL